MNVGQILGDAPGVGGATCSASSAVTPVFDGVREEELHHCARRGEQAGPEAARRGPRRSSWQAGGDATICTSPSCRRAARFGRGTGEPASYFDRAGDRGLHLYDEAPPPRRRQDPRPGDRPVQPHHPAAAGRQGADGWSAFRRDGGLGSGGVRGGLRAAGAAHGEERRRRGPHQDLRVDGQGARTRWRRGRRCRSTC